MNTPLNYLTVGQARRNFTFIDIRPSLRNSQCLVLYRIVKFRSSQQRCSIKTAVLKTSIIFTEKHLCWSLFFDTAAGLQAYNFIIERDSSTCIFL